MDKALVNGLSLAYRRRGKGLPLLLVHGFPLDGSTWEALGGQLDQDFEVIMPDLRGFGLSETKGDVTSVEQMAADLAGLLDSLGLNKTYLAGHSMGGYVALAFARAFPGRVLGLGLIDSQAAPDASERKTARYASAAQVASDGATAVVGMADKLTADPKFAPFLREIILRQPPQGLIGGLKAMAERPDATPALAEFHFPVVLVHGLADALIPPERSREMKALIPQAELVELPGMGHSPMLEAPAETARALLKLQGR